MGHIKSSQTKSDTNMKYCGVGENDTVKLCKC